MALAPSPSSAAIELGTTPFSSARRRPAPRLLCRYQMAPVISSGTLRKMHRLRSRVVRPNLWEMAPLKWLTEWIQMDLEQIWFNLGRILKVFPGKWGMILSRRLINGCKDFCAWLIWLSENMRMCTMSRLWKYQNRFWCVKNIFFRLEWILRCNNKVFQRYRGNEGIKINYRFNLLRRKDRAGKLLYPALFFPP